MSQRAPATPWSTHIGDVDLVALLDTYLDFDPPLPPPGSSTEDLRSRFADVVDEGGRWRMPVTCYLLRSSGVSILVDSGVGPWLNDEVTLGHLDTVLASAGVPPHDVDVVVTTHLHFDHVGWNTSPGDGGVAVPHFPNASYLLSSDEWTYMNTEIARRDAEPPFFENCVRPLEHSGCLRLVEPPFSVTDEVSMLPAPGHTPGHVIVRVASGGESATIIGDASHHAGQVTFPDWSPLWDENPGTAIETRREIFESLAGDASHRVVAGHWGYPGVGHVVHDAGGLQYQPV